MRKLPALFTALLWALTGLLLAAGLALGTLFNPGHRSYLAALLGAAVPAALWLGLRGRLCQRLRLPRLSDRRFGALLALVCLALHLGWVLLFRVEPRVDFATFYNTAADLARGMTPRAADYMALFPHILGYAWVLSLVFRLVGVSSLAAAVFNAVLSALSGLLLYRLCLRWRGRGTAALAQLLWGLCPSALLYDAMTLSEPWYTFLLLLLFVLIACLEREERLWPFALVGLLGGVLLTLINAARPIAAIPVIALVLWLLLLGGATRASLPRWALCLALLLGMMILGGRLWDGYARAQLGQTPASLPGYNLYVGFNTETGGVYSTEDSELLFSLRDQSGGNAEATQQEMWARAKARIREEKTQLGGLMLRKLRTFLGNDEGGAYYAREELGGRYGVFCLVSNLHYYLLLLLSLSALPRLRRGSAGRSLPLIPLYILGLTLAQLLVEIAARYHYSLIPLLCLTAAYSWGTEPGKERS